MTTPQKHLIDVKKLNQQLCQHPIQGELAYAGVNNITGQRLWGYHPKATHIFLLTHETAKALCQIQQKANAQGLGLFIYDAYRPQKAVEFFWQWAQNETVPDSYETACQQYYFPTYTKKQLFEEGYISRHSNHCFGHTVDLTLIDFKTKMTLDMGTDFDVMDQRSHIDYGDRSNNSLNPTQKRNRDILFELMRDGGFESYFAEWWHYSYQLREVHEPMDMDITPDLEGLNVV